MKWTSEKILEILDSCAEEFTFPVLDNGYVYLAATRMSIFGNNSDWAIVIEVFGFSPRSGDPDVQIYTFSSNLYERYSLEKYVSEDAYRNYLENNPFNESRFIYPIDNSEWVDEEDQENLSINGICLLRGKEISFPPISHYEQLGINLEEDVPLTFEFCRFLAENYRELVLSTQKELRVSVLPSMDLLLQLDDWEHPDISDGELPSSSEDFIQIANALAKGSFESFKASGKKNTHWRNWPEAGTL
jgi:hypothetical protein